MMVPGIAYFIPGWDPVWVKILPSYPIIQGFRECIVSGGDAVYVMLCKRRVPGYRMFIVCHHKCAF